MMNTSPSETMSLAEFAAAAGPVTTHTVRRWTHKLDDCPKPHRLKNGHLAFDRRAVERFLQQREAAA